MRPPYGLVPASLSIRQVIPPEKGVSDLVSSRSTLGVLTTSLFPDNWATDE